MNPMFQAAITPLIRALLLVATGWLVSQGIWSESFAGKLLEAAAPALALYVWAMWEKYKSRILLNTALAMPAGTTVQEVKQQVKSGDAPPASVPEDHPPILPSERNGGG